MAEWLSRNKGQGRGDIRLIEQVHLQCRTVEAEPQLIHLIRRKDPRVLQRNVLVAMSFVFGKQSHHVVGRILAQLGAVIDCIADK